MINIQISDIDSGSQDNVSTDGYLLLYLEKDRIHMKGKMDMKAIAPILTKIALEKLSR